MKYTSCVRPLRPLTDLFFAIVINSIMIPRRRCLRSFLRRSLQAGCSARRQNIDTQITVQRKMETVRCWRAFSIQPAMLRPTRNRLYSPQCLPPPHIAATLSRKNLPPPIPTAFRAQKLGPLDLSKYQLGGREPAASWAARRYPQGGDSHPHTGRYSKNVSCSSQTRL